MTRIGIYGGSFNPIHNGHLGIARRALADHRLDRILVVPARVSPFKTGLAAEERPFTDDARWQFVCAACAPFPALVPSRIELDRGGVSYAIDTVRAVRAAHPGAELFFIVGEDAAADLPKWKDWETLRTLITFVTYPRTRESSTEIRRLLAVGGDVSSLVPEAVARLLA